MLQKDRRLKDIVRTGNCIVKKFQKHHEDQLDHEQLVARVGLRLISRVVNMSKLRKEQGIKGNSPNKKIEEAKEHHPDEYAIDTTGCKLHWSL